MKPKIFVSSTILDFEDLRSALKYYLEDFGYDVQMSEYPDFNVNQEKSAFDNCIENLSSCQYFILLIGYRRGSWYKENEQSITHMEYRAAKQLIENGSQLRIISFVRKPIWLLKNDRKELIKHFEEKSTDLSTIIKKTGSTIIDDPEYIFNFIDEVAKGVKFPNSDNPVNNWIYDFQDFENIVDALKHTFKITESLDEKRIKRLLKLELERNKTRFLIPKRDVKVEDYKNIADLPQENILEYFAKNYYPRLFDLNGNPTFKDNITIPGDEVKWILFHSTLAPIQTGLREIETTILEKVINDGLFLNYNVEKNDFDGNYFTFALGKLLKWIRIFKEIHTKDLYSGFQNEISRLSTDGSAHLPYVTLSMASIGFILGLAGSVRILDLINVILGIIDDGNYQPLVDFDFSDHFYRKYLNK